MSYQYTVENLEERQTDFTPLAGNYEAIFLHSNLPYPLGIIINDAVWVIVEKDATIPTTRSMRFMTDIDVHKSIGVYVGDSPFVHENMLLGRVINILYFILHSYYTVLCIIPYKTKQHLKLLEV